MHVIALAGHVDHGKSTLVRGLTGMEPDRWAEERRRGMTIDLGYAWTRLPDGTDVAFVDVPGHHRFVPNMLAGLGPVPAVMLVVAADDGWSAQTEEHVAALHALDVRHGILAVTRSDLSDPELAMEEAWDHLAGSPLRDMEAVAVNGLTGNGFTELRAALARLVATLPAPDRNGPVRLWVDRVFSIRGAGTIVTGTLGSGEIAVGDELRLVPRDRPVRVRALQCLQTPADRAAAVSRVAVNLRGIAVEEVCRGDALVSAGRWSVSRALDVRLAEGGGDLPANVVVHIGSAAVPARVRLLGPTIARLSLATAVPVHVGERLLLRDAGRHLVLGGVSVLDTAPPVFSRRGAARRRAAELGDLAGKPPVAEEIARRGAVERSHLVRSGLLEPGEAAPDGVIEHAGWLVDPGRGQHWISVLGQAVDDWAPEHPLAPGLPRETAIRKAGLPDPALLPVIPALTDNLVLDASGLHRPGAMATLSDQQAEAVLLLRSRLAADPFAAPDAETLSALGLSEAALSVSAQAGSLLRVGHGIYLLPTAVQIAVDRLSALLQPFTLSSAREALHTTRRVAVPLMELLDRQGLTRRMDQTHRQVQPPTQLGEAAPPTG